MSYVWEKFYNAVHTLVGEGSIQDRVKFAANSIILLRPEQFNDFDGDMLSEWEKLTSLLSSVPDPEGILGTHATTANNLSDDDASQIAVKFLSIYTSICKQDARRRALKGLD